MLRHLKVPVIGTLAIQYKPLKKDKKVAALPWNQEQKQIGVVDDSPDPLFGISGHLPQATIDRAKDGHSPVRYSSYKVPQWMRARPPY